VRERASIISNLSARPWARRLLWPKEWADGYLWYVTRKETSTDDLYSTRKALQIMMQKQLSIQTREVSELIAESVQAQLDEKFSSAVRMRQGSCQSGIDYLWGKGDFVCIGLYRQISEGQISAVSAPSFVLASEYLFLSVSRHTSARLQTKR
jgi:hypothetical protein